MSIRVIRGKCYLTLKLNKNPPESPVAARGLRRILISHLRHTLLNRAALLFCLLYPVYPFTRSPDDVHEFRLVKPEPFQGLISGYAVLIIALFLVDDIGQLFILLPAIVVQQRQPLLV